ncbi:bone morphogenetic protein 10-like [Macrobrachium rosenbergii]|uniref:bone morphogenetic protein 10-like n=1 Tax=Macrobrachium rosenbergii TaxID=79674 RepID=UPI0034D5F133
MTRHFRYPAPLATTLMLVVMVGVASGVAKPAPSSGREGPGPEQTDFPYAASSTDNETDDYYYYYDYEYGNEGSSVALNLSKYLLPEEEDSRAPHVPRYMLELYEDQTSQKRSLRRHSEHDLIRSFIASSTEGPGNSKKPVSGGDGREPVRTHSLTFNVTVPRREKITSATLRLYALITRDQYTYIGVERRVRIVMKVPKTAAGEGGDEDVSHVTVCQRDVYEVQNTWETFDVTSAVKHWLTHLSEPQVLQIHIESVFSTAGEGGDLDVVTAPMTDSEPLLLVYSKGTAHSLNKRELKQMIAHEYDDEEHHHSQKRRRRRSSDTKAEQSLPTSRPKRSVAEELEEESNMIFDGDTMFPELPTHALTSLEGRRRPTGRKRRLKNSCKRKPLKVDFKDIGWDKWIIAPPSYEAYQCSGKCFYPLASHLSPTKHAVVQNLVHSLHPDRASRACCVPTKLGPISLLYVENGTPTYEYSYNDMVVLECGCR